MRFWQLLVSAVLLGSIAIPAAGELLERKDVRASGEAQSGSSPFSSAVEAFFSFGQAGGDKDQDQGGANGGQANGGQTGAAAGQTGAQATPPKEAPIETLKDKEAKEEPQTGRFGEELFFPARQAIRAARQRAAQGGSGDAFAGPSGPISLGNITATPPETYQLGPGDKLTIRVSSRFISPEESRLVLDPLGSVSAPRSNAKIVLRGLTIGQAEAALRREIARVVRDPQVSVTLDELRTFTVSVLGESFSPGSYQVPATFSIFNLVLATGGPAARGTLRSIQLRRNNAPAMEFDLYRFIILGEAKQDVPLQPGDVIFFPVSQGEATVAGEVNRPSIFELKGKEGLRDVLAYAGGVRPSAVAQNVAIDSVVPGVERRLLNIDLSSRAPSSNPPILDGDKIQVFSIRSNIRNQVDIQGPVEQPRPYAFRAGLRVADLIDLAFGLRPEADRTIAEVRRLNPDGSRRVIRVNLADALRRVSSANIVLEADDIVKVFDVNDLSWRGDRQVTLSGAVRNPGSFYRADDMRVGDLIRQGRGLEPDAYIQEAHLQRYNPDGTPGPLLKVNLLKAASGEPGHDVALQDRDVLRVYKITEWQAIPELSTSIQGSVQRPGTFPLAKGMTIKDLLEIAGGFTLNAYAEDGFLQRIKPDGTLGALLLFSPKKALLGDPSHNLTLEPRDTVRIYSITEWKATPDFTVEVAGAVQRPSVTGLAVGMTVRDLILQAGGPSLDAYLEQAFLQRTNLDGTLGALVLVDVAKALAGDPKSNVALEPRDKLTIYTVEQAQALVQRVVSIVGAVQRPGTYPRGEGTTLASLIALAGGVLPTARDFALVASANVKEGADVNQVPLTAAGQALLKDRDIVTVPVDGTILEDPIQVIIRGSVASPGTYFFTRKDQRLSDLIKAAGGLKGEAWLQGAQMARRPDLLRTDAQMNQEPRLLDVLRLIQDEEYKRALARAEAERIVFIASAAQEASQPSLSPTGIPGASVAAPMPMAAPPSAGELVTKAREAARVEDVIGGNTEVKLDRALARPGSAFDIALKQGDIITIPEVPSTILVDGPGVLLPRAFVYESGKNLRYYIEKAGGLTPDSDPDAILIVRPSGSLFRPRPSTRILMGDVIYVPTRVMTVRLGAKNAQFDNAVKGLTNAALVYGFFRSLTR
jgi:protein involved in polysaccharide export with SLBB domain